MASYKHQLGIVRQYTGDAFSPSRGYNAARKPNFGQRMAVLRYYRKIQELTSVETVVYRPKKKEKREAFNFTGQTGYRYFTKAIVRKTSPDQDLAFSVDPTLPKGHRFVATDVKTGRRYYNIPAKYFTHVLDDMDEDEQESYFEDVLAEYAPGAEFFLITAGESFMWGSGGQRANIAKKLTELFRNYSETQFDAHDKNSSYYGNWFGGVTGFTSRFDAFPRIAEKQRARREYKERFGITTDRKYRRLLTYGPNGRPMIGVFEKGTLLYTEEEGARSPLTPQTQGFEAYFNGKQLSDNPYHPSHINHRRWRQGWLAAQSQKDW